MSSAAYADRVLGDLGCWLGCGVAPRQELEGDGVLLRIIEDAVAPVPFFRTKHWRSPLELGVFRLSLYTLARALRPRIVLETGVLHGLTSLFILRALERNASGTLISVDLPSYFGAPPANRDGCVDTLPPDKSPGWIVDARHARRWRLELGNSLVVLPMVLESAGPIELFLHDSEHTDNVMGGELRLAWDALVPGGVIVCDNVDMCSAFFDFCRAVAELPLLVSEQPGQPPRFGMIRRRH
jgi:hypothetical protein